MILPDKRPNARAALPLLAAHFVAADVKKTVGKERGHLANERVEKLISGFARWVHGWIEHAPIALDLIWPRRARKLWITRQPTGSVAGNVEFRHHANAAIARVRNHVVNLVLRVVKPIGTDLLQLREALALNTETLVIGQVPMKYVELDRGHSIEIALDHLDGHPMPRYVQMQAAPWE